MDNAYQTLLGQFLSTPSARRATGGFLPARFLWHISIHALREEGDLLDTPFFYFFTNFYPRPPRGGRRRKGKAGRCPRDFYPRPPRGGRPRLWLTGTRRWRFLSTPSARRATIPVARVVLDCFDFYPRPPRGGRRVTREHFVHIERFLSTPSARRATAKTETKSLFSNKLYNILHEFRRALIYNGSKNYPNHAK